MRWWERLMGFEQRSLDPSIDYPDIDAQLYTMQRANQTVIVPPTVTESLGIPAVMRAVSLISMTIATLDLRTYRRNGEDVEIVDPAPVFTRRPCRLWTPGDFWRDTAFSMASYGEAIWLTLERDAAGFPSSIYPAPVTSFTSTWDGLEHVWTMTNLNGKQTKVDPRNITHITLLRDPATGRGIGPLQRCGAALTVAEEADRWASRFFSGGGIPSVFLNVESPITQDEADALKLAWLRDPPNMPKIAHGIDATVMTVNPENSQLIQSRMNTRAEVALMFGVPGRLLEYSQSGSSITYANVGDLAMELVRLTLAPYYLEPLEQAFSDLLPRGTEVRFDVEGLQRADAKTRYLIHEKAIKLGIYDVEYAQRVEGVPVGDFRGEQIDATSPTTLKALREAI